MYTQVSFSTKQTKESSANEPLWTLHQFKKKKFWITTVTSFQPASYQHVSSHSRCLYVQYVVTSPLTKWTWTSMKACESSRTQTLKESGINIHAGINIPDSNIRGNRLNFISTLDRWSAKISTVLETVHGHHRSSAICEQNAELALCLNCVDLLVIRMATRRERKRERQKEKGERKKEKERKKERKRERERETFILPTAFYILQKQCDEPVDIKKGTRNRPASTLSLSFCSVGLSKGSAPHTSTYSTTPKLCTTSKK